MTSKTKTFSSFRTIFTVTSGNFLEMFDSFLFGFYASSIAKAFFPAQSELSSLLLTFLTFGAGFLMRPLGALVLGAYIDRVGRRRGLIMTLALMATGTVLIAFVPDYATIGLFAPVIVLVGRLLQGFSAGVELGGVSVYLSEFAPPGKKGFYVSWQSASQQLAIVAAASLGFSLEVFLKPAELTAWGWRIPFAIGCLIVPGLFLIRRSLQETEAFRHRKWTLTAPEIFRSLLNHSRLVILGMFLASFSTVSFYLSDHGLHAHLREERSAPCVARRTHRHALCRPFEFFLAPGDGRAERPNRPIPRSFRARASRASDGIPRASLAWPGSYLSENAPRRTLALTSLRFV